MIQMIEDGNAKSYGSTRRVREARRRVGEALYALVNETAKMPDVAAVAERAGVSQRSIFRYFAGVQALEIETARQMLEIAQIRHPMPAPDGNLDARVRALVDHRADLYETVTPARRLLEAARTNGNTKLDAFISMRRHLLREHLREMLGEPIMVQPAKLSALDLVTSWEAWRGLREGQQCTVDAAKCEMQRLIYAIIQLPL